MEARHSVGALSDVGRMYDLYPYPFYPLFLPLRWIEGHAASSFASALISRNASLWKAKGRARTLIAGCGETQPYIIRKLELGSHKVDALDISSASLKRAYQRTRFLLRPVEFIHKDLTRFCSKTNRRYDHIDCYGVLHHLYQPEPALQGLYQILNEGGTARLMVYNAKAREWIHEIQSMLKALNLSYNDKASIQKAKVLLKAIFKDSFRIRSKMKHMGAGIWTNEHRFVDTFMHAVENQIGLRDWLRIIQDSKFRIVGLRDRNCELDDLLNPLYFMPDIGELERRLADGRFENNFEIFLQKYTHDFNHSDYLSEHQSSPYSLFQLRQWLLAGPPRYWFEYLETKHISWVLRSKIWFYYCSHIAGKSQSLDSLVDEIGLLAARRLARVGALFSQQISSTSLQTVIHEPLYASMEAPSYPHGCDIAKTRIPKLLRSIALQQQSADFKKALNHLKRAEEA